MVLEQVKRNEVISSNGSGNVTNIDSSSIHILQMLLSESLYSDPETAVIAEYTNNGIDSIVASGKDPIENPVIVSISRNSNNLPFSLSIKDEGLGLNEEEFGGILGSYLKSTKRADNQTLGCFGIGSKSALSISDNFFYICRKDGKEIKFMMYKGEEFTEFQKLYESDTTESNGVEVIIPLTSNYQMGSLINKAKQKLCYYDTVALLVEGELIPNKIYRNELFQWSSLNTNGNMHFALKDVYYDIDWNKLGIDAISLPVCIRFGLEDGIMPTPSRENIMWTKDIIEMFKKKIAEVCTWFVDKYNEVSIVVKQEDILKEWAKLNPMNPRSVKLMDKLFYINDLVVDHSHSKVKPVVVEGLKLLTSELIYNKKGWLTHKYRRMGKYEYGAFYLKNQDWQEIAFETIVSQKCFLAEEVPTGLYRQYLKETLPYESARYLIKEKTGYKTLLYGETNKWQKGTNDSYYTILSLKDIDKSLWREAIKEWQMVQKMVDSAIIRLSDYQISEEWNIKRKQSYKRANSVVRASSEEIRIWSIIHSAGNGVNNFTFLNEGVKPIESLKKSGKLIVYMSKEQMYNDYCFLLQFKDRIHLYAFGKQDYKKVQKTNFTSMMHVSEFLKGNNRIFQRICIGSQADKMLKRNQPQAFEYVVDREKKRLREFIGKYSNSEFVPENMLKVARQNNFWKHPICKAYKKLIRRENPVDLSFLPLINSYSRSAEKLRLEIYINRLKKVKCKN